MTAWLSGALDDLCEVEYGTRVTRKRDGGTKYPVYGGGGATFNLDDFNRQDQMIVSRFAMSEECVRFVTGKFFLNDSGLTVRTRDESKMSQGFLDQQLLTRSNEIYATARGTAQKNMDMTMFRAMELSYPDSLREQKRIVALLDAATERVTELTACYEQARTHANNLFASALRNALESNPDWPVKTLGDVCVGIVRQDPAVSGQTEFTYIDLSAINQVTKQIDGFRIIAIDEAPGRARQLVKSGDVLVSTVRPNLNAVALVGSELNGATASTGFCVLRPNRSIVEPGLLFAWARNQLFVDELTSQAKGASYPAVTDDIVKALELPVPPLEEQRRIVARLDAMRAKTSEMVTAYDAKLTAAKNLRQSILEAAFAGEL